MQDPGRWLLALAALLLAAGCGGDDDSDSTASRATFVAGTSGTSETGTWAYPNGGLVNTRDVERETRFDSPNVGPNGHVYGSRETP